MWQRAHSQRAQVIIFNKTEGVMQLHEKKGKHGAPVTCGDWLFDNRLGLASGLRVRPSHAALASTRLGGAPHPSLCRSVA